MQTLLEPARLALVSPGDVHDTVVLLFADVVEVPSDASLEESAASVAALNPVMFTGRFVAAD